MCVHIVLTISITYNYKMVYDPKVLNINAFVIHRLRIFIQIQILLRNGT